MARLARVVIPGMPHHITQRGNRRQPTFFCEEDYRAYLELMGQWCKERGVVVWAYCLMPNHVLTSAVSEEQLKEFREHERTGRVLGDEGFQKRLEKKLGRVLRRQKPGPKKVSNG